MACQSMGFRKSCFILLLLPLPLLFIPLYPLSDSGNLHLQLKSYYNATILHQRNNNSGSSSSDLIKLLQPKLNRKEAYYMAAKTPPMIRFNQYNETRQIKQLNKQKQTRNKVKKTSVQECSTLPWQRHHRPLHLLAIFWRVLFGTAGIVFAAFVIFIAYQTIIVTTVGSGDGDKKKKNYNQGDISDSNANASTTPSTAMD